MQCAVLFRIDFMHTTVMHQLIRKGKLLCCPKKKCRYHFIIVSRQFVERTIHMLSAAV